jgi:hypothetical protein
MNSPWLFLVLLVISVGGLVLGLLFYMKPEIMVYRRIENHHWETAKKDEQYKNWLNVEITTQINRTRRMGMMFIILESILLIIIFSMYMKFAGK